MCPSRRILRIERADRPKMCLPARGNRYLAIFAGQIIQEVEIFYSKEICGNTCVLDAEESGHCIKVLRHRTGDEINVIDGKGTLMRCRLADASSKGATAEIISSTPGWGGHPYRLMLAVAPTKNADRYEWFAEKACEVGVDRICPVIGQHSERKIFKTSRVEKILASAAKQSLKGAVPEICEPLSVKDFIIEYGIPGGIQQGKEASGSNDGILRMIAYCFEDENHRRTSIKEALEVFRHENMKQSGAAEESRTVSGIQEIIVMIGPEGDFSHEEADLAMQHGFIPVHLGPSRLRTETAAVTAAEAVYFAFM